MTTPGDTRRAQRRRARADERDERAREASVEPTPLESYITRKLNELAKEEAPPERDARVVAKAIVRHWGDQAPGVADRIVEYVRDEVGTWTPVAPKTGGQSEPPGDKS